jgi:ABC-2 type transport system permease protein
VLAPAGLLAALQWALLLVALPLMPARAPLLSTFADRSMLGLAAAILLPFLTVIGLLVQNAAALIVPSWIHLGKQDARGVEAMGQRLIIMAGTMIALLLAAVPAGLVSLVVLIPGYWAVGIASVPAAAAVAAAVLALEAGVVIYYLGRRFEHFDASRELDAPV